MDCEGGRPHLSGHPSTAALAVGVAALNDPGLRVAAQVESITDNQPIIGADSGLLDGTLVCFVLVDPNSQHAFSSR